jgi:hypothetical protein
MTAKRKKKSSSLWLILSLIALTGIIVGTLMSGQQYYMIKDFRLESQKRVNWCWAAGMKMVLDYSQNYRDTIPQCQIVNQVLASETRETDACGCICSLECDSNYKNARLNDTSAYRTIFSNYGMSSSAIGGVLSWEQTKTELEGNYPILFHDVYRTGRSIADIWSGYHVLVASGFVETPSHQLLFINDPWEKCKGCSYLLNFNKLTQAVTNTDTTLVADHVNGDQIKTIYHVTKATESAIEDFLFSIRSLQRSLKSIFNKLRKPDVSNSKDEILTIRNFLKEIPVSKHTDLKKVAGFDPGNPALSFSAPFTSKMFDVTKILKTNESNKLNECVLEENTTKIVNISDETGATSMVKLSKVNNGNDNFWIINSISSCSIMTPLNSGSEIYTLYTPENQFSFEKTTIKNLDYYIPVDTYIFPLKTKTVLHALPDPIWILEKGKHYPSEKIHYFLKTILNKN